MVRQKKRQGYLLGHNEAPHISGHSRGRDKNRKMTLITVLWNSLGRGGGIFLTPICESKHSKLLKYGFNLIGCIVFSLLLKANFIWYFLFFFFCCQTLTGTSWLKTNWGMEMFLKIDMQMICLLLRIRNILIEVTVVQVSLFVCITIIGEKKVNTSKICYNVLRTKLSIKISQPF